MLRYLGPHWRSRIGCRCRRQVLHLVPGLIFVRSHFNTVLEFLSHLQLHEHDMVQRMSVRCLHNTGNSNERQRMFHKDLPQPITISLRQLAKQSMNCYYDGVSDSSKVLYAGHAQSYCGQRADRDSTMLELTSAPQLPSGQQPSSRKGMHRSLQLQPESGTQSERTPHWHSPGHSGNPPVGQSASGFWSVAMH